MDIASIAARIEQAVRHIAEGNRRISRQQEIIASLERNGSNVAQALALLKNLLFSIPPAFLQISYIEFAR
jgi:hypothetical protein